MARSPSCLDLQLTVRILQTLGGEHYAVPYATDRQVAANVWVVVLFAAAALCLTAVYGGFSWGLRKQGGVLASSGYVFRYFQRSFYGVYC